jgi:hypothetical protein
MNRLFVLVALTATLITGCGGGGSGSGSSSTQPTATDTADAKAASMTLTYDPTTRMATLQWNDTFPDASSYQIQDQSSSGAWQKIDAVPGTGGSGKSLTWSQTVAVNTMLRVVAVLPNYVVPLETPGGQDSLQATAPSGNPTIVLNQMQPVSGSVTATIGGGGTYASVTYYVDLQTVGTSTQGPNYAVTFDTSALTEGSHLLLARLETSPGSYVEIRLTMQVTQPAVAVTIISVDAGSNGYVDINIEATAASGITTVTGTIDGQVVGTLNAPNACFNDCVGKDNAYLIAVPSANYASGVHTFGAQAVDGNGQSASTSMKAAIDNPPQLTLTAPVNGVLANGSLLISGTFSSDKKNGEPNLTVMLGDVPVLSTKTSPFSTTFSLVGVTPGSYTLTATVTDSSRDFTIVRALVSVTSSTALTYSPLFELPISSTLWDASGSYAAYEQIFTNGYYPSPFYPLPSAYLRSGTTVTSLDLLTVPYSVPVYQVSMSGGFVSPTGYVFGQGNPGNLMLALGQYSADDIYMWTPNGARTDLSVLLGAAGSNGGANLLALHWPWVMWANGTNSSCAAGNYYLYPVAGTSLVAYNAISGEIDTVPGGGAVSAIDFYLSNAGTPLLYFERVDCNGGSSNVFLWNQATQQVTQVTTNNISYDPASDGTFLAWREQSTGSAPYPLLVTNLSNNTTQTLTTNVQSYYVGGGIVAWTEPSTVGTDLIAYDGTGNTVVSSQPGNGIPNVIVSGGFVVFEENSALYAWSPSGGRKLIFQGLPVKEFMHGSTLYFVNSSAFSTGGGAVYAVTLN